MISFTTVQSLLLKKRRHSAGDKMSQMDQLMSLRAKGFSISTLMLFFNSSSVLGSFVGWPIESPTNMYEIKNRVNYAITFCVLGTSNSSWINMITWSNSFELFCHF